MMWRGFGGPGPYFGGCGGWGIACMILMIVFWAFVIGFIVMGAVRMRRHGCMLHHGWHQGADALDIAKQRYARGEIDQKEFEEIKKNLS
jgi:putative membrane protein